MVISEPIEALLADMQTISEIARAGVVSTRDIVIEPGETRPAAIQFVDVVGFTQLSRRLSSEALTKVIDRAFRIFELTVKAHGGYCDKVIGDAALYVFAGHPNYPPVCEAVLLAALKLSERIRQINHSLTEMGVQLAIRQGVAFGDVTRQAVGSVQAQLTVMGETVNLAQRLEAAAQPGAIQTTIRVLEKAGDAFIREPLGKLELKGLGLVTAYNITGLNEQPVRLRGAFRKLTPLIGRQLELQQACEQVAVWLQHRYASQLLDITTLGDAPVGRNRLLLISGAPAVGKSRLAYEVAQTFRDTRHAVVITAHCSEQGSVTAFTAEIAAGAGLTAENLARRWEELCRHAGRAVSQEYAERQRLHLGLLAYVLNAQAVDAQSVGQSDPRSYAMSCELAVRACCELLAHEDKAVLLIIEDLQWLGGLESLVRGLLARACLPYPLVVIATARPGYRHEPGSLSEGQVNTITLGALSNSEGQAILDTLLPGLELPPHISSQLHARAGGIPYYYEDFVRMLVRRRLVVETAGRWQLTQEVADLDIPEDLRALMLGQLDLIGESCREVARRSSALGKSFHRDILAAVEQRLGFDHAGHPDEELDGLLAEHLLSRDERSVYSFLHILLHQAVYSSLLVYNRRLLHSIAAEVLARQYTPGAVGELELLTQLIHHYANAGQYLPAHEAACRLLQAKAAMHHFDGLDRLVQQTEAYYDEYAAGGMKTNGAGATNGPQAASRSVQYNIAMADVLWRRGDPQSAKKHALKALDLAGQSGDNISKAQALNSLNNICYEQGAVQQAREYCEQALALRRELGDRYGESISLNNLGILFKSLGQVPAAQECFEQALALRLAIGDRRGEAGSLSNLGLLSKDHGLLTQARDYFERARALYLELGDRNGEGILLNNLGNLFSTQGLLAEARSSYEQSLAIRRECGSLHGQAVTLHNLGTLQCDMGMLDSAGQHFEQSLAICRRLGDRYGICLALGDLGQIHLELGALGDAEANLNEALAIAVELEDPCEQASSLLHLSRLYLKQQRLDAANAALMKSTELLTRLQDPQRLAMVHCAWVHYNLALACPDARKAVGGDGEADSTERTVDTALAAARDALAAAQAYVDSIGSTAAAEQGRAVAHAQAALEACLRQRGEQSPR